MDMDDHTRTLAKAARGFMPEDEGDALFTSAQMAAQTLPQHPFLEIGSYCGKSSVYLGAAAAKANTVLFAVDHHRGSEENQPGWEWHEPDLVDEHVGKIDTLARFRHTIWEAGLEDHVIAVVADAQRLAQFWGTTLSLLFIDGGHGEEPAHRDYELWTPYIAPNGLLLIHDVFPDPADGGRPPFEIYQRALASGNFSERNAVGSLRVLQRHDNGQVQAPEPKIFTP